MKFKLAALLLILTIIFQSCDPLKVFIIKTSDKNDTSISVYAKQKILSRRTSDDTSRIVIIVPFIDSIKRTKKVFTYGIGVWSDVDISNMAMNIDSIVFKDINSIQILNSKTDIEKYLKKHINGLNDSVLTIEAK